MQTINTQIYENRQNDPSAGPSRKGHTQVCLVCDRSLLNRQSDHILREYPSSLILNITNGSVCHACWLRFRRKAISTHQHDEQRDLHDSETHQGEVVEVHLDQSVDSVSTPEI
ncbi:hypothetical protein ACJJTC_018240 [Scirpophaga incertulas]